MCNGKLPCTRSSGEDFKIKLIFQDGLLQGVSNLNRPLPTCSRGRFEQIMLRFLYIDLSPFTRYGRESSINTNNQICSSRFIFNDNNNNYSKLYFTAIYTGILYISFRS